MSKPRPGKPPKKKAKPPLKRIAGATLAVRSHGAGPPIPAEVAGFPILEAYAPIADVWSATGYGSAAILRKRPDGKLVEVSFKIDVREGIGIASGKADLAPEEPRLLQELEGEIPAFEAASAERAAEFIWGAYALNRYQSDILPGVEEFLRAVPRPPGDPSSWLKRFLGPGGLTPTPLVELVHGLPAKGFTDTMEPRVDTAMTFEFSSRARAIELLQACRPEFSVTEADEQSTSFDWTRKYPPGHWSPLAALGGRQIIGNVTVEPRSLVARAHTLSMAARLAETLKVLLGAELRLRSVHWHDPSGNVEKRAEL